MRSCRDLLISIIFLGLLLQSSLASADALIIDAQRQFEYAERLYAEGLYQQAAAEYDRFAFFFPKDPSQGLAIFKSGQAYIKAGDPAVAIQRFALLAQGTDPLAIEAQFMMAESYLALKNPRQAILQLRNIILSNDTVAVRDRALLRIGWIYIDQMNWEEARAAISHMSESARQRPNVAEVFTALGQADQLPQKNPTLAGALSIIPGAGQLYLSRYQDALAALIVNGGLFWASYESFDHDLNALGGLLAIVGFGFYAGNIYSAVSGAHKYNLSQNLRYADLLKQHLEIGTVNPPGPQAAFSGGWGFSVSFNF